jgi:hypothetical protein
VAPAGAEPSKPVELAQMDVCVANAGAPDPTRSPAQAAANPRRDVRHRPGTASSYPDGRTWSASAPRRQHRRRSSRPGGHPRGPIAELHEITLWISVVVAAEVGMPSGLSATPVRDGDRLEHPVP